MSNVTIDDIDRKLNEVLRLLSAPHVIGSGIPAYERAPVLEAEAIADSQTVNRDGSIWAMSRAFGPIPAANADLRKVQVAYGYISEKKCPRLWALARKLMAPEQFAQWEADWKAHPYGIYGANPADTAPAEISVDDLAKITDAFMFNFRVQRIREHQQ